MHILIYGTGGVGGYFGGRLAEAGHQVTFVARGQHLDAMLTNGLKVLSPKGDLHLTDVQATADVNTVKDVDLVLIAVKAWQVTGVAETLKAIIGPNTIVMPLQNGVLANQELVQVLGPKQVVGGLCRIISKIDGPGVIRHMMYEPQVVYGELDGSASPRMERLSEAFATADFVSKPTSDIRAEQWKKFLFICSAGLGAVTRVPYGTFRSQPETRRLLSGLLQEIYLLATEQGLEMPADIVERTLGVIDSLPAAATASMQRDIMEGRPSELHYLNGSVVQIAEALGVHVPINRFIYHGLLPMERAARGEK